MFRRVFTVALLLAASVADAPAPSSSYYVAPPPAGSPAGKGTRARPWDLATALAGAGGRIRPGDTVWLTSGRYVGSFRTQLLGAPGRPIVFRQAPDAHATIDGTLFAQGADLAFWGFEIMQSRPSTYGLQAQTNNGRFINLIIHDAGSMGVSFWTPGEDAELYGCIVYHNGTHGNQDHGVYVHNERGIKQVIDNVFFNNLAYGVHAYAAAHNPPQRGIVIQGNIAFNNGTISTQFRAKGNILAGGEVPMSGLDVSSNFTLYSGADGVNLHLGYAAVANEDVTARGNFIWGGEIGIRLSGRWKRARIDGNTMGGARSLLADGAVPFVRGNLLYAGAHTPSGPVVFVRPNRYETGRAFIVVYNFPRRDTVRVDVRAVLHPGQAYEVRSVQNVLGEPLAGGTYTGDSIPLSMSTAALDPVLPIGRATATPPLTRPLFDVFLLTTTH
jgi:hypothetical protein